MKSPRLQNLTIFRMGVLNSYKKDDELGVLLSKALEGDRESASIAGHRLKFNICVPVNPA